MEYSKQILCVLVSEGYLSEEAVFEIETNGAFLKLSKVDKVVKESSEKKKTEGRIQVYDTDKCDARIWNDGYDNEQCQEKKKDGLCFCEVHQPKFDGKSGWWLGNINEPRPENPIWEDNILHHWRTDTDGNEIKSEEKVKPKEEGTIKKKRGRPKGSKNKKKQADKKLSKQEIKDLITQKEKEMVKLVEEKETVELVEEKGATIYTVDGVPYDIVGEDLKDPISWQLIGTKDLNGGIKFEDEDAEENHKQNIIKYKQ